MRKALADFDSSLDRIRALANSIAKDTGAALANAAIRELHETQQCGAVVLLTGYFEAFLKDLVRRFIRDLCTSGVSFPALPVAIQHRHFEGGGDFLRRASIANRTSGTTPFGSITREDVVMRLHSVTSGAAFEIVWEAFADTESNPGPGVVRRIGSSLGLDANKFWITVSAKCGTSAKWSAAAFESSLAGLIAQRNECAHTGKVSPVPTATEIIEYAEMLGLLATGFVATLEDHLGALRPAPPASPTTPPPP